MDSPPPAAAAAPAPIPESKPVFQSAGYKIHNEITYRGVDWFLNSTLGVAIAYCTKRTPRGRKYVGEPLARAFETVTSKFTSNPKTISEGGHWGSTIISIIIGGMAIIPVMIGLENKENKKRIVKALDERIYGADAVNNDPKFQEQYEAIDHEPEKDFITGNLARAAVLAPMIASTQIPMLQKTGEKYLYNPLGNVTKYAAESAGIKPQRMIGNKSIDGKSNWDFLHQTIGFDFGLTFIYSFLHEYAYKAFAAIRNPDKPKAAAPAPAEKNPPPAATCCASDHKRDVGFAERIMQEPKQASMAMGAA